MNLVGKFPKAVMRKASLGGKTVLLRADYNVPLKEGKITDDFRIRASIPTIKYLLSRGCKVVIISHLGRPDGKVEPKYSLEPVSERLGELLGRKVQFVDDSVGPKVRSSVRKAPKNSVILLENLRFHAEEELNDYDFAKSLALDSQAEYFVQDGFGVVHRAHASTSAITLVLPSVAGLLLEKEYMTLTEAVRDPKHPLVAVFGGAKISDKIAVIKAFVPVADTIIIGGAMANTFLAYRGYDMAASMLESGQDKVIDEIYKLVDEKVGHEKRDDFLVLPVDLAVSASLKSTATRQEVDVDDIPAETMALDLGTESSKRIVQIVAKAKTVIWNGTLGLAENPAFATASDDLATVLKAGKGRISSIIGGGDTADFVLHWDKSGGESFSHVSTGGGASIELLGGARLPGIEALLDAR